MIFKNMSIGKRQGLGFGIIILLYIASIVISYIYLSDASKKSNLVQNESLPYTLIAEDMVFDVLQVESWLSNVAATKKRDGFKEAENYAGKFKDNALKFKKLFEKKSDLESMKKITGLLNNFDDFYNLGLFMANSFINESLEAGNLRMEDFDGSAKNLISKVTKFRKKQESEIKSLTSGINNLIANVLFVLFVLGGLSIFFSIFVGYALCRSIIKAFLKIGESSENIVNGSKQLSESSQVVAQGASEQASSTEQIASSIVELNSQSKEAAKNTERVQELSAGAMSNAETGGKKIKDMLDSIQIISDSSKNIAKIMKSIDGIAFQTNLLALNAAVEAARAGQHGKGFAVVAEEVNNLSKRSATAARETADIIDESLKKIDEGLLIAKDTESAFQKILLAVGDVSKLTEEITISSMEQVKGIEQVERGIQEIDKVVQQNASASEENASSSSELRSQAIEMQAIVAGFLGQSKKSYKNAKSNKGTKPLYPQEIEKAEKKIEQREIDLFDEPRGALVKPEDIIALEDKPGDGKENIKSKDFDNF